LPGDGPVCNRGWRTAADRLEPLAITARNFYRGDLAGLDVVGRRSLRSRTGVDFASNDYLGLAGDGALLLAIGFGSGSAS